MIVFLLVTAFFANEKLYHYVFNKITVPSVIIHGYKEDGEFQYDTNEILKMPHVKNLMYEYDIYLDYAKGEEEERHSLFCLPLNETTRETINFHEPVDENAIILSKKVKNKEIQIYHYDNPLDVKKYYYEGNGVSFLKGYCFLSQNLYDELLDKAGYDSSTYSKTLLVNFEKSEHIYEFLQTFHSHFDEDDVYISYQTDKLDKIAKETKLQPFLIFSILLIIVILYLYKKYLRTFIQKANQDLNEMSKEEKSFQLFKVVEKRNSSFYVYSYLIIYILTDIILNNEDRHLYSIELISIYALLSLLIMGNEYFVKTTINKCLENNLKHQ